MNKEETEQSYSEKGMDMLHGPLLKKLIPFYKRGAYKDGY